MWWKMCHISMIYRRSSLESNSDISFFAGVPSRALCPCEGNEQTVWIIDLLEMLLFFNIPYMYVTVDDSFSVLNLRVDLSVSWWRSISGFDVNRCQFWYLKLYSFFWGTEWHKVLNLIKNHIIACIMSVFIREINLFYVFWFSRTLS